MQNWRLTELDSGERVISERLDSCLDQIRTERCGNPIDHIERIAACRKAMLCK